jgi:poly-beta-1,6-N-acetyl-D-glucosamine N-deacetylase
MLTRSSIILGWFVMQFFGLFLYSPKSHATVVLQYHHISNQTPAITSISPTLFEQHLDYLKQNRFKVLSLEEFIRYLEKAEGFPTKSVLITFDDGYRSIYDIAFPLLKKYKYPFTVFVNTQPLQQELQQFMNWEELQNIIDYGGAIANHTHSHPHMILKNKLQLKHSKAQSNREEIKIAERLLSNKLSKYHRVFAYPYGEFDPQVKSIVEELGYIAFGQHSGVVGTFSDQFSMPRFPFGGRFGKMEDFKLKVNSRALQVKHAILLDENENVLESQLIPHQVEKLKLLVKLSKPHSRLAINCFASDGSQLEQDLTNGGLTFTLKNSLSEGRSRINCTAASDIEGAFYWFSLPLVRADARGEFYQK